ncbi:hypothetical protein G3M58_81300 [Streptomyces sp. SID7499]|uniref:Uncharacterized protein n=1 Tax=Streptomyces sp. SID7499 TaxID=2706086 RepID=A0A6G3XSC0_9ACTN|nr:hypothetical protein [Streptomyces sp. SID7499]
MAAALLVTASIAETSSKEMRHSGLCRWWVVALCLVPSVAYLRLPETAYAPLRR